MARISVVIATHNRAALLEATLAQLRHQQYEPGDEVLVVDNGSTDRTREVTARAREAFPAPLRYLRELAPGKTPALNAGLDAARGDILALTDDDILVADDWLATIRKVFAEADLVLAGGRVDPEWERPAPAWLHIGDERGFGTMASPLALLHYGEAQPLGDRTAVGANLIVRRRALDEVGTFAAHLGRRRGTLLGGEDHEFCQRLVAAGYRCEYRPEIRVRHWVPASRVRLSYYLRWFFWSGVTNAMLDTPVMREPGAEARRTHIPLYMVRQALAACRSVLWQLIRGRKDGAARCAMDAAYALGYIAYSMTGRPRSHALLRGHLQESSAAFAAQE